MKNISFRRFQTDFASTCNKSKIHSHSLSPKTAVVKLMATDCFRYFWYDPDGLKNMNKLLFPMTQRCIFIPAPSPFPIKRLLFTPSFPQVQVFVLAVSLALLYLCFLANFLLILFSCLSFPDGPTPCPQGPAGNCCGWYRNIINYKTPACSCLGFELYFMLVGILF